MQADIVPAIKHLQGQNLDIIHQFKWKRLSKMQTLLLLLIIMIITAIEMDFMEVIFLYMVTYDFDNINFHLS